MSGAAYALHGTTLAFDRPVPLLRGVEAPPGATAEVRVRFAPARSLAAPRAWAVRWTDDGSLSEAADPGDPGAWWLRFLATLDVRVAGPPADADLLVRVRARPPSVTRTVVDLVVPMLRTDAGALGLHAAAFTGAAGGATVVLGPNGAGKSTLTALAAVAGRAVLADDCVVVAVDGDRGGAVAHRGVPSVGVHPAVAAELGLAGPVRDDEDEKVDAPLAAASRAAPAVPLERIVLLGPRGDGLDLAEEAVPGSVALAELADQVHSGVRGTAPGALLHRLADLLEVVPVVRARVPEGLTAAAAALERSSW